ncbi:MAG: CHASE3 domain-containing protein [Sphingomonas sp.]|uniref:CHASE3 domain-containing protein n=1 Tax=Sphingomonas sp. TaxID=28214 RepID=UPI001AC06EAA|nr:CHASE3 domain-containing protein [Sphingomonas sp.]MBN8809329.1 CHASE3 domain-containing protein [Sphingomonas sp.]
MSAVANRHDGTPTPPSLTRFILLALIVPAILIAASAWLGTENARTEAMRADARAAFDRSTEASTLIARIADAESSQRGYVLTGDPQFLDPYVPARLAVMRTFDQLARELRGEPAQAALLARLRGLAELKFAEMDQVIADRRDRGLDAAIEGVQEGRGKHLMDAMRGVSTDMLAIAQRDRDARVAAYARHVAGDRFWIWVGIAVAGLLALGSAVLIWLESYGRYRARLAAHSIAERNRSILDSTTDAITILNPSGTIESINPAAAALLGYRPEEVERRDVSVLMDLLDRTVTFHERIGLVDGKLANAWLPDRTIKHKDGHTIPVDIALGVMPQPDGCHIVASARDISERKRIERVKDELMSTVSHELRTPLTSVVGALGLLRAGSAGKIPAPAQRLIEIAENNSRRLIRLINDMLDIDRMQSGKLQIERQPIDLRDVVTRAGEGIRGSADAADVPILCRVPDDPVRVMGDAERLLQVIANLASNAVRVSPAGSAVEIGLTVDNADGRAVVTIDDHGPGLPAEFRDRIFGRFERAAGEQGVGTGLGLAISREIIGRHYGRIWFEDRPVGTRFAFQLDLIRDHASSPDRDQAPRILIVEDDADTAETLRQMVAAIGHAADCVGTAARARTALAEQRYAALLLDLRLPDENGLAFAHSLYASDGVPSLPIIIVSGMTRDGAGEPVPFDIVDWIEKPVDPTRLAAALAKTIERLGAQPTILHLDDDQDMLDVVEAALSPDARIVKVRDLASARAILEHESPDLAIMDLHLAEGSSGLDLLPMLIDRHGLAIPTIIFSAHDVSGPAAGQVDAVLVKSRGSLPDLRATVRRVLEQRNPPS